MFDLFRFRDSLPKKDFLFGIRSLMMEYPVADLDILYSLGVIAKNDSRRFAHLY